MEDGFGYLNRTHAGYSTAAMSTEEKMEIAPCEEDTKVVEQVIQLSDAPPRHVVKQFFAAIDTEGVGDSMFSWPTVAVGIAVVDEDGTLHHKHQTYMPYNLSEKEYFEPRCYTEFWKNTAKCPAEVLMALIEKCNNTEHKTMKDAWEAVGRAIDEIYAKFDSPECPLIWVGNCLDYDYGRVEAYLSKYKARAEGLRYNPLRPGKRHYVEDCGSGADLMKLVRPDLYVEFKDRLAATKLRHTHDCLDDAIYIATHYALYNKAALAWAAEERSIVEMRRKVVEERARLEDDAKRSSMQIAAPNAE